jgi:hypothetical protein
LPLSSGSIISEARNQNEEGKKQKKLGKLLPDYTAIFTLNAGFLLGSFINPEDGGHMILLNVE